MSFLTLPAIPVLGSVPGPLITVSLQVTGQSPMKVYLDPCPRDDRGPQKNPSRKMLLPSSPFWVVL